MSDLVAIVPSRGRPQAAADLVEAFGATRTLARLVIAVDEDDPLREAYFEALGMEATSVVDTGGLPATMVRALNASAITRVTAADPPFAVAFMGDDHRPRTNGWDRLYLDALRELGTGIVYGNDQFQKGNLPTQCAMTADIVRTLGYMAPPTLKHLYVDTFWRDLGNEAGCLRYLPDVVVEHLHPLAGKADWDDGYRRVNSDAQYAHDRQAYRAYKAHQLAADVAKVQALR